MQNQISKPAKDGTFLYLLVLTIFFIFAEISFFVQTNKAYLANSDRIADHLSLPASVIPGVLFFIAAQLSIHLIYCMLAWAISTCIANWLALRGEQKLYFCMGVWSWGLVTALVANQYLFPNSIFAALLSMLLPTALSVKCTLFLLLLGCVLLVCLAAFIGLQYVMKASRLLQGIMALLLFTGAAGLTIKQPVHGTAQVTKQTQPNIIIIGIDSLRPDYVGYFNGENKTPFLDSLLNQSVVFGEAITPLARTFPSWISILTGEYPKQNTIRTNLAAQTHATFSNSLPAILRQQGYETIFATDETRFSNIDQNMGFDQIISPPIGVNDFLVGTFNDFPLSNFLVNTALGKWLFPYSYANRPVFFTYQPNSFLELMRPALFAERDKPLFLTVHFCLAHFPYVWADLPANDYSIRERYTKSVQRIDKQVQDFYALLQQAHLLDNAIVVVLSDHGEALELSGDRITYNESFIPNKSTPKPPKFYPPSLDDEAINQSAGHGGDVLGLTQYHALLAFKLYGNNFPHQAKLVAGIVSLLSIKPTILSLLNDQSTNQALSPWIKQAASAPIAPRHFFLESDYSPTAIRTVHPEVETAVIEGIELFRIDPQTAHLVVRDNMNTAIIESKQYADIYGDWMLALYPQNKTTQMPILVNLMTGKWTNDLTSSFAQNSPAGAMLKALKAFYGEEIREITPKV